MYNLIATIFFFFFWGTNIFFANTLKYTHYMLYGYSKKHCTIEYGRKKLTLKNQLIENH